MNDIIGKKDCRCNALVEINFVLYKDEWIQFSLLTKLFIFLAEWSRAEKNLILSSVLSPDGCYIWWKSNLGIDFILLLILILLLLRVF